MPHKTTHEMRAEMRRRATELRELRQAERELALHHPDELMRIQDRGPELPGTSPADRRIDPGRDADPVREVREPGDGDLEVVDDLAGLPLELDPLEPLDAPNF